MKPFIAFLLFCAVGIAQSFSVGSYNVQNLFDLHYNGTEYGDYIPNRSTQWNARTYGIKLANIAKVIDDMQVDVICLQEIESKQALDDLQKRLPNFTYSAISQQKKTAVQVAIMSRFPITSTHEIIVNAHDRLRPIFDVQLLVEGRPFRIYINHWKSKRGKESKRVRYAKALMQAIEKLPNKEAYIIVGDLNSNYNEFLTFKRSKRLNDTLGVTGINHYLKTIKAGKLLTWSDTKRDKRERYHYNLWMELQPSQRFSHLYRGRKGTLDNMLIPRSVMGGNAISYKRHSFSVFKPAYLYRKKRINHWKMRYKKPFKHLGKGFSDHLPIMATFTLR